MNTLSLVVLFFIISIALIESILALVNLRAQPQKLPSDFKDIYSDEKYQKSKDYHKAGTTLSLISKAVSTILVVVLFCSGAFNTIDQFARSFSFGEIGSGLLFYTIIGLIFYVAGLPFQIYSTFNIEQRFGFNRTNTRTYILDTLKGALLTVALGGPLIAAILWLFGYAGQNAWLYCWLFTFCFSLFIQVIAPVAIMPLFNKFTPLEEGSLRDKITDYAEKQSFTLQGIFTMDGSKRSSKLNAFFTGLGKYKKIALFDTLIEKLSEEEIVAVLAHEIGHSKRKHLIKGMVLSTIHTGAIFYILSLILKNDSFSVAFGMEVPSIYASLFFFGYLFGPVNFILSAFFNKISRKHEFEADHFAAQTIGNSVHLITALKKLSGENMATLYPHPLYVTFYYSHPPLGERIESLNKV